MSKEIDSAIELQLDLMRVSASVRADVVRLLKKLEREIVGKLAGEVTEWSRGRLERQLSEIRREIASYYSEVAGVAAAVSVDVATVAATVTAGGLGAQAVLPSSRTLETIVSRSVVQGAAQGAWWAKQGEDVAFRFSSAVRQGLVAAETNQQIVQRVRQVLEVSRKDAATLVQTSVATVANDSRMAVAEDNMDIIKRFRALATLDTHTCLVCAPLDGLEWEKDGTPIGHSFKMPRYPLHMNCRCLLLPRVSTGEPGGGRAAAGGPVDAKTTFADWLKRQPDDKVEEILGKERASMYLDGKLTLTDLVNGNGRPLKVFELKSKYGI